MKTIITLDKADQPYGFPQLDGSGSLQHLSQNLTITGSLSQGTQSRNFIDGAYSASFYEGTASLDQVYGEVGEFNIGDLLYIYDTSLPKDPWQSYTIKDAQYNGTITLVTVKNAYWLTTPEAYVVSAQWLRNNYAGNGNKQIPSEFTHAEGYNTIASGRGSHAEGYNSQALIDVSHAEGYNTQTLAWASHAEGFYTQTQGAGSHAEGVDTTSQGFGSHAEGLSTIAVGDFQHVSGRYNQTSSFEAAFIHGSGADNNNRSNLIYAHGTGSLAVVEITGSLNIAGNINLNSGSIITENSSSLILAPPGAEPGQTLTIRPTVAVWGTTASGFIVYGQSITISIQCLANTGGLGVGYFGTLNYEITGTGVTEQSLGRPLTGQVTFQQGQASEDITWTIPSNSSITDFTLTISSVQGTYTPSGPGYFGDPTLFYNFEANGLPNGQFIIVTNNGVVNSEHSHVHLVSGNPFEVDLYLGDDDQYVKIEKNAGDVVVGTNLDTHKWVFDTSGSLTVPGMILGANNLATTGSNTFKGNQIITGSSGKILLYPTVSSPNLAIQEIHSDNDTPWTARFYNDAFSTTNSVMSYFGWSDGRFVFHNDSTQSIGIQVNGWSAENGLLVYQDKVAFVNNVEVTGSINITGNLNVIGTSSFSHVTASVVSVGTNIIVLNTNDPASRYGGITVIDSGSFGNSSTGSLLWDSHNNRWVYANPSGSTYDGGMLISGPRNTSGLGNEQGVNSNFVTVGMGGDHIQSGTIFNSGSGEAAVTQITGSLLVTNNVSGSFTGSLFGTASYSANADLLDGAHLSILATTGSNTFKGNQIVSGSVNVSGSLIVNNTNIISTIVAMSIVMA